MSEDKKYRLITRSDMDGLVCGVLLKSLDMIDEITFVHPKDMQDGIIEVGPNDITTNLPYVDGVHLAFDHHTSETIRIGEDRANHIIDPTAPSAARVVYNYFGGGPRFRNVSDSMMTAVDRADSAQFTRDEILNPRGWVLLSFLMDARTGLGRFRDFRISNYELMEQLIDHCLKYDDIDEILRMPDVQERVYLYQDHDQPFREQLKRCTTIHDNLAILDLREEDVIYAGNRFMIYALFPETNISIHELWGKQKQNIVFATGKSILNKSSRTNIGELMLKYGGGGHENAGTCQVPIDDAERVLGELIEKITSDG